MVRKPTPSAVRKAAVAAEQPIAGHRTGVEERGMLTLGFSEELGRPDDFRVERAERSHRMKKLQASEAGARQSAMRRLEVGATRTSKRRDVVRRHD
jgi:hypothetical protein